MDSAVDPPRVTINEVGDVVLDDARQLRALADGVALAAFTWLQRHGPGTAAHVADELAVDRAQVDARLEALQAAGLAQRDQDLWRCPGRGLFLHLPEDDPEAVAAARTLSSVMLLAVDHLPREWVTSIEPGLDDAWAGAAGLFNAGVNLTAAELDDVQVELERVLTPYLNRSGADVPADARRVRVLAYFLPEAR
jgi:DNA-binding MarR family transcriptional regulator